MDLTNVDVVSTAMAELITNLQLIIITLADVTHSPIYV